jgi:hypothetical protein
MEAADFYDAAVEAARGSGYVNIEALAAELAGRFWLDNGKADFARIYLDKAVDAYVAWGAAGKADDLRAKYGLGVASYLAGLALSVVTDLPSSAVIVWTMAVLGLFVHLGLSGKSAPAQKG